MVCIGFISWLLAFAAAHVPVAPEVDETIDVESQFVYGEVLDWDVSTSCHGTCLPGPMLRLKTLQAIRGRFAATVLIDVAVPDQPWGGTDVINRGDRVIVVVRMIRTPHEGWPCGRLRPCGGAAPRKITLADDIFRRVRW